MHCAVWLVCRGRVDMVSAAVSVAVFGSKVLATPVKSNVDCESVAKQVSHVADRCWLAVVCAGVSRHSGQLDGACR